MRRNLLFGFVVLGALGLTGCLAPVTGPQAVIVTRPSPPRGEYPLTVEFAAAGASDDIVQYLWVFGDGVTASGREVEHTYAKRDTHIVYLTVVARNGRSHQATIEVHIHSKRPLASFGITPTSAASVDRRLDFDATGSSDPDGSVAKYHWDFGDGTARTTDSPETTHTYTSPGEYIVTLVVEDEDGDRSLPLSRLVTISPRRTCC